MAKARTRRPPRPERAARTPVRAGSWWSRLPHAAQHAVCLGTLLTIGVIFYAPILFSGQQLVGSDTVKWRMMAQGIIDHHEATGEGPLWSPRAFGGMPSYMITRFAWVPGIDSLANWLRPALWPLSHFAFLLGGAYLLGWWLTRQKWAGVTLAAAFGLTTYVPIILAAGHNSKYIALCYTPWLVLAFAYALRNPRLMGALLFAVALSVHLRAGHPQITYYALWTIGIWWLVDGVAAWRTGLIDRWARATAWLTGGGLAAALMVAYPYLLQREYKGATIRGAVTEASGGVDAAFAYAMNWSHTAGELLTLLVANAYGGGGQTYWGEKIFTSGPHYVGGVVVLLAVAAALLSRRRVVVWALGLSAGLMLLFALGENLVWLNRPLYDFFPLFDSFRVPETWLSQVAFCAATLAALGVAAAVPQRRSEGLDAERERAARSRVVLIAAAAVSGFVVLLALAGPVLLDFSRPGEVEQAIAQVAQQNQVSPADPRVAQAVEQAIGQMRDERRDLFTADAWRTVLFTLLAAALLVLGSRGRMPAWTVQVALALLVTVDLAGVGRRYIDADALPLYDVAYDGHTDLPAFEAYDFDEFVVRQVEAAGGPGRFRTFSLIEGDPTTNARPSFHYESVGGYHGAKLRLFQDWLDHLLRAPGGGISPNGLRLLAVRYVVAPEPIPGYEVAYRGERTGALVLRDPEAPPRAFFAGEIEVLPSEEALWARVHQPTFDPDRTALVEAGTPAAQATTTPIGPGSTARATVERFAPDEIVYAVETDAPRLLVMSEVYYPDGWNAYVDGERVPVLRVDHLLRGVEVPAGAERVVMRFEPATFRTGFALSAASAALVYGGIVVLLGLAWRRRREAPPSEPPPTAPSDA